MRNRGPAGCPPGPLRRQIEDYYIVDFSEWQDEVRLRAQFRKLRSGLQINYPREGTARS